MHLPRVPYNFACSTSTRDARPTMNPQRLAFRTFLLLLTAVSVAFAALLQPWFDAVFWGAILALLFMPLYRRLLARMPARPSLAALATLLACLVIVVVPVSLITGSLVQEGAALARRAANGEFDLTHGVAQLINALPAFARQWLTDAGIVDLDSLRQQVLLGLRAGSQMLATQAVAAGQNTLEFLVRLALMLYLLFFLLRDGAQLVRQCRARIPLDAAHQRQLVEKFATVVRATVKGNLVIAIVQGVLGGLMFWALGIEGALLWGALMAVLSLLPAVGAALIWFPVAVYFLVTGATASGIVLMLYGMLVIGLADNLLRPMLVGKDTKLPDYLVLLSTLGGLSLFGLNGFVIGPLIAALFITCWDMLPSFLAAPAESGSAPAESGSAPAESGSAPEDAITAPKESTDSPPAPAPTAANAAPRGR